MSEPEEESEVSSEEFTARFLAEYEDEIIECSDIIDTSLQENLINTSYPVNRESVIYGVETGLTSQVDSDTAHHLAHHLLHFITSATNSEILEKVEEQEVSEKLLNLLKEWILKYNIEAGEPNYREYQGRNFWRDIRTDLVLRGDDEVPGLNHNFIIADEKEVEITVSLQSNLAIVEHLLSEYKRTIERFEEEAVQEVPQGQINNIKDNIREIESLRGSYTNKNGDD